MLDKSENERRKQIKKALKEKEQLEFEQGLPMSRENFQFLFDFLDAKLYKCNDTLKLTTEFLEKNAIKNIAEIEKWLNENGGYCDCEVLNNIEEKFDEDAIL